MSISWIWRAILRWTSRGKPEPEPLVVMSIMSLRQAAPTPLCPKTTTKILYAYKTAVAIATLSPKWTWTNREWVCRQNPYYAPCRPCDDWSSVVSSDVAHWIESLPIIWLWRWEFQWAAPSPMFQSQACSNHRSPDLFARIKRKKNKQKTKHFQNQ